MVLLLKQWKSRSSPGFAAGVDRTEEPIYIYRHEMVPAFLAFRSGRRSRFKAHGWRGVEQPGSSSGS